LADEYQQIWLDDCTALVGEENAEAAFEKLSSMVTGDVYGEDAVEAYANGGGAYFCGFTNDLATLTFDGETSTIFGTDKDGNELFSHTYHYVGMEPMRLLYSAGRKAPKCSGGGWKKKRSMMPQLFLHCISSFR
jgi:hypothetical protein